MKLPLIAFAVVALTHSLFAAEASTVSAGDRMMTEYFRAETERLSAQSRVDLSTLDGWTAHRAEYREQLFEMLGLSPRPERSDLHATITGRIDQPDFFVEKLHFQSLPGLYATANLYVPKNLTAKAPAILYVCGHANAKEGGVSYGAKAMYQHHGAWLARHGYVCLLLDTIQLGELEGLHHGTHHLGMFWWNSRGYTPAGAEAWNFIRALDYLETRPEVDATRLGMTGRSGGGGYTWYTAALDERIKVAVPVAGLTDLHNHVIDGTVKSHCDCMFLLNTYRWDFSKVAALLAPRPVLFSNSDKDTLFPLDGVLRVHRDLAALYKLYHASDKLGLLITEGPHKDTQDLQVPALRWFNRWLKGEPDTLIKDAAEKLFTPAQLKVFATLPTDERTTKIHETFVPLAAPPVPANAAEWAKQRDAWMQALRAKVFRGWPEKEEPLNLKKVQDLTGENSPGAIWEFTSQGAVRLRLVVALNAAPQKIKRVYLRVLDDLPSRERVFDPSLVAEIRTGDTAVVLFEPRGIGPTKSTASAKAQHEIRRGNMLLGQTVDGMRAWDICRAVEALRQPDLFSDKPVHLRGVRDEAINALYASLFIEGLAGLELVTPPTSHMTGPDYLNVLRFLDIPQAAALAAERQPVKFSGADPDKWSWTTKTAQAIGLPADCLQW